MERKSLIERNTAETQIKLELNIDGEGTNEIQTGIGFFDHMLRGFSKHGFFDLKVEACGDLEIDAHHTVEDVGIVLGNAIKEAVGNKEGIKRFGTFVLPMDDALVLCAIDLSGRPFFQTDVNFTSASCGEFDNQLVNEFFYAISYSAGMNLHFKQFSGVNDHHIIEAMFKAFGKALDMATLTEERCKGVLSTKGILE